MFLNTGRGKLQPRNIGAKQVIGTLALALLSVVLSSFFKHELGAPNYGLGVVIGVTLTCYFFGLAWAVVGFGLAVAGDLLLSVEATDPSALPRLLTIILTLIVSCGLVVLLQNARRNIATRNLELNEAQEQLARALDYERNISSTLQRVFLPIVPKHFDRVSIATFYEAGSEEAEIGGDFYDVLRLNDNQLLISLGDVSGKGLEAARQAAGVRYGLRSCILRYGAPAEALGMLNRELLLDPQFDGFATLFVAVLDTSTNTITYCSGGHEPPIMYRPSTGECTEMRTAGMVVGAVPTSDFAEDAMVLNEGDVMLLYTDGLSEARSTDGMLGSDGLARILSDTVCRNTSECLQQIVSIARDYAGGRFRDDVAAILLRIS